MAEGDYMDPSLTVKYYHTKPEAGLQSFDLRVEVTAAENMSPKIFVMQHGGTPAPVPGSTAEDRFTCIADPVDLEEFPEDAPDLANEMPYYRVNDITLRFRSIELLQESHELIDRDIRQLVKSLKAALDLEEVEEVTYV